MKFVEKPWGFEHIWAETDDYVAKMLHIEPHQRLSLQYHEIKEETVYVPHEQCFKKRKKIYTVTDTAGEGTRLGGQLGHDVATLSSPLSQTSGIVITLGGALVGHLFEREKNSHYIETPVCEVRHTPERKTTIDGFLVTYEYNGQYYQTRTKVKPGTMIRIVIKHEVQ